MKIIVNSLVFAEKIRQAFDVDAHVINWYGSEGKLIFGTTKYQSDVTYTTERQHGINRQCKFNYLGMAKLLLFLKELREQPVTVTLDDDEVRVEHSVIDFVR